MIIKLLNADFSNCGIGVIPFEISSEAKEFVSLYNISDAGKKQKAELAMQSLMDQLGYDKVGSIWGKIGILMLPCLADNLNDSFINVVDGEELNKAGDSRDILNLYELSNGGLHWSYSKAYAYYQSQGGAESSIPPNWCNSNVIVKEKTFISAIKAGVVTVNNVVQPTNSFILSTNMGTGTGGLQPGLDNGVFGLKWLYVYNTGSVNIISNTGPTKINSLQSVSYSVYDLTDDNKINGLRYKSSYGLNVDATGFKDLSNPITVVTTANQSKIYPFMSNHTENEYKNIVHCLAYMVDTLSQEELTICNNAFDNFAKTMIE